jgi:uncharacterized protein
MRARVALAALLAVCALLACAGLAVHRWRTDRLRASAQDVTLAADGAWHPAFLLARAHGGGLHTADVSMSGGIPEFRFEQNGNAVQVYLRAPVEPRQLELRAAWRGRPVTVRAHFLLDVEDSFGDGTPDFLRLHQPEDRQAFRGWFTAIANHEADLQPDALPSEIDDCAALLRFAYRGALHLHDAEWLQEQNFGDLQELPSSRQYAYPHTPMGTGLFRIAPAAFTAPDLTNGAFAQFADAKTLWQRNTYFVTRDVHTAQEGDLLFYRQLGQNSPYHSMIVSGGEKAWVVYHTGPIGKQKGEMRRVSMSELLHHPDVRWRPLPENANFLGVYRWNILREGD